jgi:small-conductance mechanosensitive channel
MKEFLKSLGDMFLDQAGGVDEKRILGVPIIIVAVVYVCITANISVFAAIAGLGTALLGIGVAGDQGKLNISTSPSNPSAGLPGS